MNKRAKYYKRIAEDSYVFIQCVERNFQVMVCGSRGGCGLLLGFDLVEYRLLLHDCLPHV